MSKKLKQNQIDMKIKWNNPKNLYQIIVYKKQITHTNFRTHQNNQNKNQKN